MTKNLMDNILAINPIGPNFGHGPIVQPWPMATSRGHQISSAPLSPQLQGISSFPSYHPYSRLQAWRINQLISLTSYGGNQKTLQGSQPPVSAGVG
ncbi:hypothetical protein O181_094926, partial [Austropuccinia psidii MF-1]|nr:hypothetical protein [Austropuccinia psidii MF-1]